MDSNTLNYSILTDTGCDLPFPLLHQHQVEAIGMVTSFNGRDYIEDDWASLDPKSYYDGIRQGALPTTSQVTPGRFVEFFTPHLKSGKDILYIGFSSVLSGTFGAANVARTLLLSDFPDRHIELVDSKCASAGLGLLVRSAAERKAEGEDLDGLIRWLEEHKLQVNHLFTVDDLNHLKRGGRVSALSAAVGTLLAIKPILHMSSEGRLQPLQKVKGRKKALLTLAAHCEAAIENPGAQEVFISHSDCAKEAAALRDMLVKRIAPARITLVPIGMTIGAHTGPGTLNLVFFGKHREALQTI